VGGDEWRSLDQAAAFYTLKRFLPAGIVRIGKNIELDVHPHFSLSKSSVDLMLTLIESDEVLAIEVERLKPGEHSYYSQILRGASADYRRSNMTSRMKRRSWAEELRNAHSAMQSDYILHRGNELRLVGGSVTNAAVRLISDPVDIHRLLTECFSSHAKIEIPRYEQFKNAYDKIRGELAASRDIGERGPRCVLRRPAHGLGRHRTRPNNF